MGLGYMHHWRRAPELSRAGFSKAVEEIRTLIERASAMGIKLAGPTGEGDPEITDNTIAFNGLRKCGHRYRDLGHPRPSKTAEGVEATPDPISPGDPYHSGAYLETRVCGGSCAGAPFVVDRVFMVRPWDRLEHDGYLCSCETDFKPYDLVVTAALARLKENLGDEIRIATERPEIGFEDAKRLCRELFGWPERFKIEPQESEYV